MWLVICSISAEPRILEPTQGALENQMTKKLTLVLLALFLTSWQSLEARKREARAVTLQELADFLPGKRVSIILRNATRFQAQIETVHDGLLEVVVGKSTNLSRFPRHR